MRITNNYGLTIVELMIALAISGIVMGSIGTLYVSYQKQQTLQEEVTEMQQEVRVALEIATREIRHAGHDVTAANTAGAGFAAANPFRLQFTMDLTDDPGTGGPDGDIADANENVTYRFSAADDADDDGIANAGVAAFRRRSGVGLLQDISSNIHAIAFAYAYDSNNDGMLELNASGEVDWAVPDGGGGWIPLDNDGNGVIDAADGQVVVIAGMDADATQRQNIRAVKVWILARTSRTDPEYTDNVQYKVGANLINPNDNFRRRLMTVDIRCRNMGLQ